MSLGQINPSNNLSYLISTTCTKSDDSEISSKVALKAATYSEKHQLKEQGYDSDFNRYKEVTTK